MSNIVLHIFSRMFHESPSNKCNTTVYVDLGNILRLPCNEKLLTLSIYGKEVFQKKPWHLIYKLW